MRQHASFDYPSSLPPVVDVLLLLVVTAVFWVRPVGIVTLAGVVQSRIVDAFSTRTADAEARSPRRLSDSHLSQQRDFSVGRAALAVFVLGVFLHSVTFVVLGSPKPWVSDEHAYLLGAETFAQGRATNPLPVISEDRPRDAGANFDQHLKQGHVLSKPTRQSKYPPAQSLWLAPGMLVGQPQIMLPVAAGALGASFVWALAPALPPATATLGAFLILFWVGIGSYWNQGFWGGSLSAIGGALVVGGYLRLRRQCDTGAGAALGLGALTLALTRPFEGLIFCLPFAVAMVAWCFRGPDDAAKRWRTAGVTVGVLGVGLLLLVLYQRALTGYALLPPHFLYTSQDAPQHHHFFWRDPSGHSSWPLLIPEAFFERGSKTLWFLLGTPLCFALVAGLGLIARAKPAAQTSLGPRGARWSFDRRDLLVPGIAALAVLSAQAIVVPWHPHYPSPAHATLLLIALFGLELSAQTPLFGRTWREPLLVAALVCAFFGALLRLPAHRVDPHSELDTREAVVRQLEAQGGLHVVFVDLPARDDGIWVHNPPDPLAQPVLWVRDLGRERDERLVERLGRTAWVLEFADGTERLKRFGVVDQ